MLAQSLPPIVRPSEARATEPGLHSSGEREGRDGRRVSVAMFPGSLLSGGSMGRLILRADMAMLYVGQQQLNNSDGPKCTLGKKCFLRKAYCKSLHIAGIQKNTPQKKN